MVLPRLLAKLFADLYAGNTPLHLALESAHAEVAVLLINAGARRDEVSLTFIAEGYLTLEHDPR